MARATIDDVARAAGVSTFTVSRALRGKEHVAAATRAKVLKAAQELNYTASRSAASLASGRTNRVALLSRERISGWFIGELMEGLVDVLAPAGYDLTIYRIGSAEERSGFFTNLPANRNADALVVTGFAVNDDEKRALTRMNMPIVSVNASDLTYCQASIAIDDEGSEASVVRYLAALGHRRFCYVGRLDPLTGDDWGFDARTRGYQDEVTELGLHDCGMFFVDATDRASIRQTLASILALPERPTAMCVWSDQLAVVILNVLRAMGVRVPQDISVFGFDGSDAAATVGLSTMTQPARRIGRLAAQRALTLIDGKTPEETHTVVPTALEPGSTAGPAPRTAEPTALRVGFG